MCIWKYFLCAVRYWCICHMLCVYCVLKMQQQNTRTCRGKCLFTSACLNVWSASMFGIALSFLIASLANPTAATALENASARVLDNSCSALEICWQHASDNIIYAVRLQESEIDITACTSDCISHRGTFWWRMLCVSRRLQIVFFVHQRTHFSYAIIFAKMYIG